MLHLNHRQCRQARSMLKWNPQDLAGHTKLSARRIEAFERGLVKLETFELREIYEAFSEAGLQFSSTQVTFKKKPRERQEEQLTEEVTDVAASTEEVPESPPDAEDRADTEDAMAQTSSKAVAP